MAIGKEISVGKTMGPSRHARFVVNGRPRHRIGGSSRQGCSNEEGESVRKSELESLQEITAFTSIW